MILPKVSNDFINLFLKNVNNIKETKLTKKNNKIMREFYHLLNKYEINMNNVQNINIKNLTINNDNKQGIINNFSFLRDSNIFLSDKIQNIIRTSIKSLYTFNIQIGQILFTTNIFVLNGSNNIEEMKIKIIRLLFFISNFITNRKLRTLKINIVLTNFKKELPRNPNEILDSYHINTGVTWACKRDGEIVIYREEEWFKVLIHELFHSLCFDFSNLNINKLIKDKITKMFFIKNSTFSITETYCEFWANIINSILMAYSTSEDFNEFLIQFEMFNTFEKYFSIFQCIKVLHHMNLSYDILISRSNIHKKLSIQNYKERTNVLGYFIIKMIWLFYTNEMLSFFSNQHEYNIINSNKNYHYLTLLINKTTKLYNKNDLLKEIIKYSNIFNQLTTGMPMILSTQVQLMRSLRMTIIEIN
jgi:hypothetical protein